MQVSLFVCGFIHLPADVGEGRLSGHQGCGRVWGKHLPLQQGKQAEESFWARRQARSPCSWGQGGCEEGHSQAAWCGVGAPAQGRGATGVPSSSLQSVLGPHESEPLRSGPV